MCVCIKGDFITLFKPMCTSASLKGIYIYIYICMYVCMYVCMSYLIIQNIESKF